jgi:hypothetical protein
LEIFGNSYCGGYERILAIKKKEESRANLLRKRLYQYISRKGGLFINKTVSNIVFAQPISGRWL